MGLYEILALTALLFLAVFIIIKWKAIWIELKRWNGSFKYQLRLWSSREFIVLFASFAALDLHELEALPAGAGPRSGHCGIHDRLRKKDAPPLPPPLAAHGRVERDPCRYHTRYPRRQIVRPGKTRVQPLQ